MRYESLLFLCAGASRVLAACTRSLLEDATSAYIRAQSSGQPSLLPLASSNLSYSENDTPMDISKGVLSQAVTIDFNRSLHDAAQCATFTEITAATNKHPYVIHTRMLLDSDNKITTIESVVTDDGDWAFNATGQLQWTKQEKWDPISEAKRDSRAVIKGAGDAYLDQWGNSSIQVPLGTPCARLEGGSYTGQRSPTANTCKMPAFPNPLKVGNRRYVIDEELGAVDIFNGFPFLEKSKPASYSVPSSNLIRVEEGKIRYIHEVTVCLTPHCGR
ncbi:hypothetical protein QBC46DRAFT_265008 [Diplogelasinospora grovesii]|uniref:DUF8021 domain-containing protein n=1 Tax=Diplogelasinospora grovesii TaxID=303347 RepID=A0AAN6N554_9PEZI|nr:hypothetical protein QBC46DRAFT_265008 [Diplogelasinospora grovesii]